jgi:hypothetical protein
MSFAGEKRVLVILSAAKDLCLTHTLACIEVEVLRPFSDIEWMKGCGRAEKGLRMTTLRMGFVLRFSVSPRLSGGKPRRRIANLRDNVLTLHLIWV